jgi:hypothetical protein
MIHDETIEGFISQQELNQLLDLEKSMNKMLLEANKNCKFMFPISPDHNFEFETVEEVAEPLQPQLGGSLKNLENYVIKGDLRRCVICNEKYAYSDDEKLSLKNNLPRVLYCGDCLCEECIVKLIQRASV